MARPKGSKNKPRAAASYETQMKDIQAKTKAQNDIVENLEAEVEGLMLDLASKKKELRSARTALNRLARQASDLEAKADEMKRREEATKLLEEFLASGKTVDELQAVIKQA